MNQASPTPSETDFAALPRGPVRMCIGCRSRHQQGALLRFRRRRDGQVVPALRHGDGRSAYLCPSHQCYEQAFRRKAWSRALSTSRGLSVRADEINLWTQTIGHVETIIDQLERSGVAKSGGACSALAVLRQELGERGEDA